MSAFRALSVDQSFQSYYYDGIFPERHFRKRLRSRAEKADSLHLHGFEVFGILRDCFRKGCSRIRGARGADGCRACQTYG